MFERIEFSTFGATGQENLFGNASTLFNVTGAILLDHPLAECRNETSNLAATANPLLETFILNHKLVEEHKFGWHPITIIYLNSCNLVAPKLGKGESES